MKYDYGLNAEMRNVIAPLVGHRLDAYLSTDDEEHGSAYETFALRLAELDVEFTTKEIVGIEYFDETNTLEVFHRPDRKIFWPTDTWMKVRQTDGRVKKVKRPRFYEIPVGRVIDGISIATETLMRDAAKSSYGGESGSIDFIRAVVLHFGDDALVFDKGGMYWSEIWNIRWCKGNEIRFPVEDDPDEYPEYTTSVRLERFDNTKRQ